jgi:hypothetical protein
VSFWAGDADVINYMLAQVVERSKVTESIDLWLMITVTLLSLDLMLTFLLIFVFLF